MLNGGAPVALPWSSLLAFVRLVTNPRLFRPPQSVAGARAQVEAWLGCDLVWIPNPGDRHVDILGDLLRATNASSNLVPDAHLAALAIEHGLTLCSTDSDFARFKGLSWTNPLSP